MRTSDFNPSDTIPAELYDEDKHSRPRNHDGKWYALVEVNADPKATASEVREAVCRCVEVDLAEGETHCLEGVSICVDKDFGLYPDRSIGNGCDVGPVIDWP